jgi:hypothetical protein
MQYHEDDGGESQEEGDLEDGGAQGARRGGRGGRREKGKGRQGMRNVKDDES